MSKYDDIVAKLQSNLALILQANGYRTDAGASVFLNLEYQTQPEARPCLILFPGDVSDSLDGDTPPSQGEENHTLPISIEGWVDDTETGAEGQKLRQDILQALKADRFLGGLTEGFSGAIGSNAEITDNGDGGFLGFARVEATIFYVTAWGES